MLCYFCPLLCCISVPSSARVMSYVLLSINSRHDMFRWLSELCITVTMASDISLIIIALCSLFHDICLFQYQLSPWHISLIITSLCYLAMVLDISLIIRSVCSILHEICLVDYQLSPWHVSLIITALCCSCHGVRKFTDYQNPVVVSPWHLITHWMQ